MKCFLSLSIALLAISTNLCAAETGMPQLDPKYWASQAFWLILVFTILYISISKFYLPKIKDNLDNREKKIKENLDEAKELSEQTEKKKLDYENEIIKAKKEVVKIISDSKKQLDKEITKKKELFEKEFEKELHKAESEILSLKNKSHDSVKKIAEEISSKIIEEITGEKLNNSSIKASVEENFKKKVDKFL